jgi:hypothetical protein
MIQIVVGRQRNGKTIGSLGKEEAGVGVKLFGRVNP